MSWGYLLASSPRARRIVAWTVVAALAVGTVATLAVVGTIHNTFFASSRAMAAAPGLGCASSAATPLGAPGARGRWSSRQMENAATIVAVGRARGVPRYGWVIAVATAMQESYLRNLPRGHADSLGLFQQRPSAGWGSRSEILTPRYAAAAFYGGPRPPANPGLTDIDGWRGMPVTEAAQAVQHSATPTAYAQWADDARQVVTAVTRSHPTPPATSASAAPGPRGRAQPASPALTGGCAGPRSTATNPDRSWPDQGLLPMGLTPRAKRVMDLVERRFDEHNIGGYCPGGCTSGHTQGSDHYTGQAIDVMILPYTDPQQVEKGWRVANYLVNHQRKLAIKYVIYQNRIWSAAHAQAGWRGYCPDNCPYGATSNPTLLHKDHIHVSVY